jgi:hypothetical protein
MVMLQFIQDTILKGSRSNNVSIYTGISGSTEYDIDINDSIEYTGVNDRTLTFKATGTVRGAATILLILVMLILHRPMLP